MNYDDDMRHRAPENNYRPQMEPNTTRFISSGHSRSSSQQSISQTSNSDSPYMRSHNRNSSLGQMNMMSESSNTPKVAPYSNVPFIGSTSPSHFQTVSSSSHAPHGSSQFNMIGGNSHIGVVPSLPSGPTHSRSSSLQSIHAGEILQLSSGSSSDTITPTSQKSFQSPPNISGRSNISQLSHARAESLSKKIFHGHNRSLSGGNHHDFGVLMTLNRGPPRSASRNANHSHKTSTSLDIPLGDLNLFETDKNTISNDISFIIASNSSRFDISPQSGNPSSALAYEFPINLDPITTMENEFLGNMDSIEEQSELEKVWNCKRWPAVFNV